MDNPSVKTLRADAPRFTAWSMFRAAEIRVEVLRDPEGNETTYCRACRLDAAGNNAAISAARLAGAKEVAQRAWVPLMPKSWIPCDSKAKST